MYVYRLWPIVRLKTVLHDKYGIGSVSDMLLGAIEGGGTKMICAIGDENGRIQKQISVKTEEPAVTMPEIIGFFKQYEIEGLGLASFGPVDLDRNSATYGYITSTTKLKWRNYNILGCLKEELKVPCGFDTDVNGSALGELSFGAFRGLKNAVYITVGTGVGIGVVSNGAMLHGMLHPEGGHVFVKRHPADSYRGGCAYHEDCLEGMASGPSIEARTGRRAELLDKDDPVWEFISLYVAQAICDYIFTLSPERIILGGGVMKQEQLFPMIRRDVVKLLGGYIDTPQIKDIDSYIVPASLGGNQAIMGCMRLAYDAVMEQ